MKRIGTFGLVVAMAEDESLRVKNRIASGLVERGWPIPDDQRQDCSAALPPGFSLNGQGKVSGAPAS